LSFHEAVLKWQEELVFGAALVAMLRSPALSFWEILISAVVS